MKMHSESLAENVRPWMNGCLRAAVIIAGFGFGARPASAVEVDQVLWGFDGQGVPDRFNTVAVLMRNSSAKAFDGTLQLRKSLGSGHWVGEPVEEKVFIGPYASKWVQLAAFPKQNFEQWVLKWGRGGAEEYSIPQLRLGKPARVLLSTEDGLQEARGSLRHFPASLFPPSVTVADSLHTAVLAHVPRWEESRRQAFLDWLWHGGRLILLPGPNGQNLQFPASLADLNSPLDTFRVGEGVVERHPLVANQLDREWVQKVVYNGEKPEEGPAPPQQQYAGQQVFNAGQVDDGFFRDLKVMTRPHHNWLLINFMSLVYILLIFPGLYWLGRWRADYRLVYGALLGGVALFSFGFATVGRRGYGEATAVHSVAIARSLPDGGFDVNQWSNVFVTSGDIYTIEHAGTGRIYSSCQNAEAVKGVVRNGADGSFEVDIPPFSARTYAHRVKFPQAGRPQFKIRNADGGAQAGSLTIAVEGDFPTKPERIIALYRGSFYPMAFADGTLTNSGAGVSRGALFGSPELSTFLQSSQFMWGNQPERTEEERFRTLFEPLLYRALDLDPASPADVPFAADRVKLFVYAPMPERFAIQNPRLGKQRGFVLYCADAFPPENP